MSERAIRNIAVVIGMPRAGTTWLYENMNRHPDICVSDTKEINRYLREMSDEDYLRLFDFSSHAGGVGLDISPLYYFDKKTLETIAERHDKVILIVREHHEWMKSLHKQLTKFMKIEDMVKTNIYEFIVDARRRLVFDFNTYDQARHIDEIRRIFGSKLLVLNYEEIRDDPLKFLQKVEVFLGIRSFFHEGNYIAERVNAGDAGMSRWYAYLLNTRHFDTILSIVRLVVPSPVIHWLRRRLVYGYGPRSSR